MPTYQNKQQAPQSSKPGDYILRVIGVDKTISQGDKTRGCTAYELKLLVEQTGSRLYDQHVFCDESAADTAKEFFQAKADMFLKACGIELKLGEAWDFDEQDAREAGARFINPLGLRGWATIKKKRKKNAAGSWEETGFDEVAIWITNKEKLAPHVESAKTETAEAPDWS